MTKIIINKSKLASTTQSPIQPKQTTDETTEKKTIESTPPPQKSTSDEKLKSTQQPSSSSSSHFPSVSRLLAEYNIDISKISPTGPKNRVLKGDVLQYIDENKLQKAPRQDKKPQPKQDVKKPSTPQSSKIKVLFFFLFSFSFLFLDFNENYFFLKKSSYLSLVC